MPAALGGRQTLANAVDTAHTSALECFWVSVRKKHIITAVQRARVEASYLTPVREKGRDSQPEPSGSGC